MRRIIGQRRVARASDLGALYATSLLFGFSYGAASTLFPATVAYVFGREHAGSVGRPNPL